MKTTTIYKTVLVLLLFGAAVQSASSAQNGNSGQGGGGGRYGSRTGQAHGQAEQDASGIDPADRIGELCRKNGLQAEIAEQLFAPVQSALTESLPAENILVKIEEGLAKKVDPRLIVQAAQTRLDALRRAETLLRPLWDGRGGSSLNRLISRTALVLEGGLPDDVIVNVIRQSDRGGPGRLTRMIDAGAELYKAGFNSEQTQLILADCVDRDLSSRELQRVLDFLIQERVKGRDFQSVYQELWAKPD